MNKADYPSKNVDNRLKEREKLRAEAERSMAVVRVKQAHKLIEDTEKLRKNSSIRSIVRRLDVHSGYVISIAKKMNEDPFGKTKPSGPYVKDMISDIEQVLESIRYDFQKTMDIKDEDIKKLFPKINPNMTTGFLVSSYLLKIANQMDHMIIYSDRMLK